MRRKKLKTERIVALGSKAFRWLSRGQIVLPAMLMVFLFLAVHCGGGTAPPPVVPTKKAPAAEKKTLPVPPVAEKKEVVKQEEPEFAYNPAGKPDPFKPFIQLTPEKTRPSSFLTPLQKYDLSQLKLVAIIALPEGNVALVEDQQGKGFMIKKGTAIGRRDGKVKTILKDRVVIEEAYSDIFGQAKVNEISLFLHRPEEGGES